MKAPVHVVVVGRDAPVWLSACVLQHALGPAGVAVSVVELPPRAEPADAWVSLPALEALHARLRIEESRLIGATRGAFSLGRRFTDAAGRVPAFFHAHGSTGTRIDRKEFLPQWLLARQRGLQVPFGEFSLTASAARHGRMLLPDPAIDGFGFTDYGYHLPAIPYGAWLRQLALRRGVRLHPARDLEVLLDDSANISGLRLEDGRRVGGDFFLDVTGPEALLASAQLGSPPGAGRESWRDAFPIDRVLGGCGGLRAPLPIYSEVRAESAGWVALAASQVCMHVQHAYCSEYLSDAAALEMARGMALQAVVVRDRDPGRRKRAWVSNCVAIGEAACVTDPLHFLDLHIVQTGLVHLLHLFPVQADFSVERDEYNQNVRSAFERMRDFQAAHYHLARYGDASPFWSRARATPVSQELAHKLDAFRARGEAAHYEDEAFNIDDWQQLLIGHGVIPAGWDPAVDRTDAELLDRELQRTLEFIRRKVEEQGTHAAYLQGVCALPGARPAPRPHT